ncbi:MULTISPECIES: hypothetical protein [Deinococcus]|uniref:Uncharacterized protein n=1 Tax=Deinococcus rufus TaxID=2136097 RepID=A0ABV7Z9K6_9DEIO|nr:hypothetical protein [Deinococcus sp. AB2017081]WQE95695.1 hypothetical protein U2P90_02090 [Deinococcus sp. AB2017081]
MNSTVNLGNLGSGFGVLAAALILAYGVWVGRRDLGMRAMWGVLAAVLLTSLLPLVIFRTSLVGLLVGGVGGTFLSTLETVLLGVVSTALAVLPLYVAVNWLEVIRRASDGAMHSRL